MASRAVDRLVSDTTGRVGWRSGPLVVCGLLLLAVIAVFGQTAGHNFVNFDDNYYVYENRHVREGLTREGIVWAFTDTHVSSHWHPLTWLSLMADAEALRSGEGLPVLARLAARMHLVNVVLHAANALLLFLVLRAMTASVWRSALVAAVFAVHPLHVESVAWITERKDVLSGLFGLLALGAYVRYARQPSLLRYLSVAAALALGLMAKPMLVTWPFLFLLLDYWPLGRWQGAGEHGGKGEGEIRRGGEWESGRGRNPPLSPSPYLPIPPSPLPFTDPLRRCPDRPLSTSFLRLVVEKIPLLLLVAASAAVTFLAQQSGGSVISLESVPISQRISRAAVLYVDYLGKTLWPANLAAMYPIVPMETHWPALGAGILLALPTAGALWGAWRGQRWLAVGWFWYLGTLAPTIGLVQVGSYVMADRFLYLPQIGLCVALVWGAAQMAGSWPLRHWPLAAVSALVVAGLMGTAWPQTSHWRNGETLWTHTLACTAQNSVAHNNLGLALSGRGRVDEAIAHFRKALELKPDERPTTISEPPWPAADRSTRPLAISARPWNSSPATPRPTTTLASPWPAADSLTRPSATTGRPWKSGPTSRKPNQYR